jgi:hypothetical protein
MLCFINTVEPVKAVYDEIMKNWGKLKFVCIPDQVSTKTLTRKKQTTYKNIFLRHEFCNLKHSSIGSAPPARKTKALIIREDESLRENFKSPIFICDSFFDPSESDKKRGSNFILFDRAMTLLQEITHLSSIVGKNHVTSEYTYDEKA